MSCMYLSKNHYQFIADSLYRITVQFDRLMPFHRTRGEFGAHYATDKEKKILEFVQELQDWNARAYAERYSEDESAARLVKHIQPLGSDLNAAAFLKALRCVDYQCSDATDWNKSQSAKVLGKMITECCDCIINDLPQYEAAPWSIE